MKEAHPGEARYSKIEQTAERRSKAARAVTYFFLILWAAIVLFPFYWMILTSVKR